VQVIVPPIFLDGSRPHLKIKSYSEELGSIKSTFVLQLVIEDVEAMGRNNHLLMRVMIKERIWIGNKNKNYFILTTQNRK